MQSQPHFDIDEYLEASKQTDFSANRYDRHRGQSDTGANSDGVEDYFAQDPFNSQLYDYSYGKDTHQGHEKRVPSVALTPDDPNTPTILLNSEFPAGPSSSGYMTSAVPETYDQSLGYDPHASFDPNVLQSFSSVSPMGSQDVSQDYLTAVRADDGPFSPLGSNENTSDLGSAVSSPVPFPDENAAASPLLLANDGPTFGAYLAPVLMEHRQRAVSDSLLPSPNFTLQYQSAQFDQRPYQDNPGSDFLTPEPQTLSAYDPFYGYENRNRKGKSVLTRSASPSRVQKQTVQREGRPRALSNPLEFDGQKYEDDASLELQRTESRGGTAQYNCPQCEKTFSRAYNLRSHMKTHTSDRPYACSVCNKAFARLHDRKRHEDLHNGEKRFVCYGALRSTERWGCQRRFARADALARHFRTEVGKNCINPLVRDIQANPGDPNPPEGIGLQADSSGQVELKVIVQNPKQSSQQGVIFTAITEQLG